MDYQRLASELLRELRGQRSQAQLMRRLGYRANVPYLWESGRRFPPISVLFRLLTLNRLPLNLAKAFAGLDTAEQAPSKVWRARESGAWLRQLLGKTPATDLARAVQSDRGTVARWLRGETEPRVPELLQLLDVVSHRLVEFVSLFATPEHLPSLRDLARELHAQTRIAYDLPWTHAVLRALELRAYTSSEQHMPGVLAAAVGIELEQEERLLTELRAAGLIRRSRGKWRPVRVLTIDTRTRPEGDRRLKLHWARVGVERLAAGPIRPDTYFSFNLCAVSNADFARIRELHQEYYDRVRRIVADSTVADRVLLLNQQLIPLDGTSSTSEPVPS